MLELKIAVVIVTYKSAGLTIDSLASIEPERKRPGCIVRAVVVDNASGDLPQIELAVRQRGWSDWVTLLEAPTNGGFAYGNNVGIAHAYQDGRPDYVYLLNPDAQVRAGAIATLVDFLETHPAVGIAGSSFETLDGSDWPMAFRFPTLQSEIISGLDFGLVSRLLKRWEVPIRMPKIAQPVDWICGASMMVRPAVLAAIGALDENYFLYFEETDFCLRAKQAGFPTWYVPASRVMHIMGQSTSVTDVTQGTKRLPGYWFESRRRYFIRAFGVRRARLIDLVAVIAHALGLLKRFAQRRTRSAVPYFVRDLLRHSALWPHNQDTRDVRAFFPRTP
jgi:GT2 family glycosyltransferase